MKKKGPLQSRSCSLKSSGWLPDSCVTQCEEIAGRKLQYCLLKMIHGYVVSCWYIVYLWLCSVFCWMLKTPIWYVYVYHNTFTTLTLCMGDFDVFHINFQLNISAFSAANCWTFCLKYFLQQPRGAYLNRQRVAGSVCSRGGSHLDTSWCLEKYRYVFLLYFLRKLGLTSFFRLHSWPQAQRSSMEATSR